MKPSIKPALGRVVHYHFKRAATGGMVTRAAVISHANPHTDDVVDLHVYAMRGDFFDDGAAVHVVENVVLVDLADNEAPGHGLATWPPRAA